MKYNRNMKEETKLEDGNVIDLEVVCLCTNHSLIRL